MLLICCFQFFIIVLILAVIELGAAIFAVTNKQDFHDKIAKILQEGFKNDPKQFNIIQDAFNCCGLPNDPDKTKFNCTQQQLQQVHIAFDVNRTLNVSQGLLPATVSNFYGRNIQQIII